MTLEQELAQLRAENEKLRAIANKPLTVKISDKGAVCVYGMGRFPVALYRSQWLKLSNHMPDILAFINQHMAALDIAEAKPRAKAVDTAKVTPAREISANFTIAQGAK